MNDPSSLYEQSHFYHPGKGTTTAAEDRMMWNLLALIPAVRVGRGVLTAGRVVAGTRPVKAVIWAKRPVHQTMVDLPFLWHPTRMTSAPKIVTESLKWRKRAGLAGLGVSTINPLQNIRYARDRDWTRLGINLRYPIVGVPLFEFISNRLGAPDSAAPNAPTQSTASIQSRMRKMRPSGRPSTAKPSSRAKRARRNFRGKCPPGFYWSWKKKRCVKSKY